MNVHIKISLFNLVAGITLALAIFGYHTQSVAWVLPLMILLGIVMIASAARMISD